MEYMKFDSSRLGFVEKSIRLLGQKGSFDINQTSRSAKEMEIYAAMAANDAQLLKALSGEFQITHTKGKYHFEKI